MINSTRDVLIDKVQYGEISPAEAEAEAADLKLGPLDMPPRCEEFRPNEGNFLDIADGGRMDCLSHSG